MTSCRASTCSQFQACARRTQSGRLRLSGSRSPDIFTLDVPPAVSLATRLVRKNELATDIGLEFGSETELV